MDFLPPPNVLSQYWAFLLSIPFLSLLVYPLLSDLYLQHRMPPGPPPLPILGNRSHLPKTKPWLQFKSWSATYGPIYTLWMGRRPTLVISDPQVAVDLLEKRSSKYSSRPRSVAMGELFWDGASILTQPYGKGWSNRRKLLHSALSPPALKKYKAVQTAEATRLCAALVADPGSFERHIDRFTASVVFAIAYGRRIDSLNAAVIRERLRFMQFAASLNIPGKYLVESFPVLKYVPRWMAPWKREMQDTGREEARANMALVERVREDLAKEKQGTGGDGDEKRGELVGVRASLTAQILALREKDPNRLGLSDRDFSYVPASLFGAGSDTTASTLCSGLLALITHPHCLRQAHAELVAIVGSERMPTFEDEKDLPYIRALCKEILRWRPVAVLGGTPHASTEGDVYRGWYIPRGTAIIGNSWAINMNGEYYTDPDEFEPARFLELELKGREGTPAYLQWNSGQLKEKLTTFTPSKVHPSPTGHSSFGWGRRICPGQGLAENSLFIALSRMLWAFDILPKAGKTAEDYDTSMDVYTDGFNIRPRKFECIIRLRDQAIGEVLRGEEKEAWDVLGRMEAFEE